MTDEDKPSIAYVDESSDERDNFYVDAYGSGLFSEIHRLHPDDSLDVLISQLLELQIDALVSDFRLSDANAKAYTGADVVRAFLDVRRDFPCFVLTSFDDDAMLSASDVNLVYSKDVKDEQAAGRNLFKRVSQQIVNYRSRIEAWADEFNALSRIEPSERTVADVERLIQLDHDLEQSLSNDQALAKSVKRQALDRTGLTARQDELMDETEKLIASIKQTLG